MNAIVNHLPSGLATWAPIPRPAKAKGTGPACPDTCCKQGGEKQCRQVSLLRKRGHGYQSGRTQHQLHLQIGSSACSSFPVTASALPAPTLAASKMVPCTKVLTRETQKDAEPRSSHDSFKRSCLPWHTRSGGPSVLSGHKFMDSNNDFTWH